MAGYSKVAVIGGPTACGKSGIALQTAVNLSGEIICADSMQIYTGVSIGTAAPSEKDYETVPHHLYGFVTPETEYSLFDYQKAAYDSIDGVLSRERLPVLCGGTGLYISALCEGINLPDAQTDRNLREKLSAEYDENPDALYQKLLKLDPEAGRLAHINNKKRIVRYLELYYSTGKTYSERAEISRSGRDSGRDYDFRLFILEPDRVWLRDRINRRIDKMKESGLLEEAREVYIHRGEWKTLAQAIGYKELFPFIDGSSDLESCIDELKTATYHYAKRQFTWFNRISDAVRIPLRCDADVNTAAEMITEKLK